MKQILKDVNAIYSEQNPSTYIDSNKKDKLTTLLKNKRNFFNMKLTDLAIFHENLIHKSNKNFTNKIRFSGIIRLRLN
jgi:hypothetical protein